MTSVFLSKEVLIVDGAVHDALDLLQNLDREIEVLRIVPYGDGLGQIARHLSGRRDIGALHVLSHGAPGALFLAGETVDAAMLRAQPQALAAIAAVLSPDAAVVLYGCSVAAQSPGAAFIDALETALGGTVFASALPVGSAARGGGWMLRSRHGATAETAFTASAQAAFGGLLATDTLTAGDETPVLSTGDDTVTAGVASSLNAGDVIDGLAGTDTLLINAAQTVVLGATTLTNFETITITDGVQNITTHDSTVGAGQILTVSASASSLALTWLGAAETDGHFHITGGSGKDSIRGGALADTVYGGAGNDTISGDGGTDLLFGQSNNDTIYGGAGNDTIYGGDDNDFLYAGADDDLIYGEGGNDGISGDAGNDTIWGGDGNDTLIGGTGNDVLSGEAGNDWIWGQDDNDTIYGGAGTDTLSGNAGADVIYGGDDVDTISGGAGADTLYGEGGNDTFAGSVSDLDGDTIADLAMGDSIVVNSVDLSALNGTAASSTILLDTGKTLTLTGISAASGIFQAVFAGGKTTIALAPNPDSQPPVITSLDGDSVVVAVGLTAALDVAGNAGVTDADSADFNNGALTLTRSGNLNGNLVLDGANAVAGTSLGVADSIVAAYETIFVGGTAVGTVTFADGQGTNSLVVTLNGNATPTTVATLLHSIKILAAAESSGSFAVTVTDRADNVSAASTIAVSITPPAIPPAAPNNTQDGVPVTQSTTTGPGGGTQQTITVAPTGPGRPEDPSTPNGGLADIVIVPPSGGGTGVTVSLPTGTGFTASGSGSPVLPSGSLDDLIARIQAVTTANTGEQTLQTQTAQSFLSSLPSTSQVIVQTIVPTTTLTTPSTQPLVITGSQGGSSTYYEAFVIDTRSLPSGSTLQLQDIEFASIRGSATVTGGAGSQYVVGDDSQQYIFLGPDDDTLIGGAGDDTVGSAGGRDVISGGAGNDSLFGGADNDFLTGGAGADTIAGDGGIDAARFTVAAANATIVRGPGGAVTVTTTEDAVPVTDTLTGVEVLVFSDRIVLVQTPQMQPGLVDEAAYLAANPDVAAAVQAGAVASGAAHFAQFGAAEGRAPNALFDPAWYVQSNPDVAAVVASGAMTAWQHYLGFGSKEGRDPGPLFDVSAYLAANPDIAASGIDPLTHYLLWGAAEGRIAVAATDAVFGFA
ncbi:MAG: DUF4347 domain-containing protein [Rhodospirillales bacterium]